MIHEIPDVLHKPSVLGRIQSLKKVFNGEEDVFSYAFRSGFLFALDWLERSINDGSLNAHIPDPQWPSDEELDAMYEEYKKDGTK